MSTNIIVAYQNYLSDTLTAITCSTASVNYPLANLFDYKSWKRTWFTDAGWEIEVNFGYERAVGLIGIMNSSVLPGSVAVKANTSATFVVPAFSDEIEIQDSGDSYLYLSTAEEYQYWQLSASVATMLVDYGDFILQGAGSSNPKIGELFMGPAVVMNQNFSIGYGRDEEYRTAINRSEFGAADAANLVDHRRNTFRLGWRYSNATVRAQLRALQEAVKGSAYPFIIVPDHDSDNACYYVRMQDKRTFGQQGGFEFDDLGQESLTLIEELRVVEA